MWTEQRTGGYLPTNHQPSQHDNLNAYLCSIPFQLSTQRSCSGQHFLVLAGSKSYYDIFWLRQNRNIQTYKQTNTGILWRLRVCVVRNPKEDIDLVEAFSKDLNWILINHVFAHRDRCFRWTNERTKDQKDDTKRDNIMVMVAVAGGIQQNDK